MAAKVYHENPEKEAIRRNLLATMLCSANTSEILGSLSSKGNFWQGLFKKVRMF